MARQARDHSHFTDDIIDPATDAPTVSGLRLAGPFRVSFDTPDITVDDILLTELSIGTLVWGVRVIGIESFDGNRLSVVMTAGGSNSTIWLSLANPGPVVGELWAANSPDTNTRGSVSRGGVIGEGSSESYPPGLYATLGGGETDSQGAADVYALILEPS